LGCGRRPWGKAELQESIRSDLTLAEHADTITEIPQQDFIYRKLAKNKRSTHRGERWKENQQKRGLLSGETEVGDVLWKKTVARDNETGYKESLLRGEAFLRKRDEK